LSTAGTISSALFKSPEITCFTAVAVPLDEARSSSLGCEARAKARRIVTSSSSVRVGAAVPQKSGCLRYWKVCGRASRSYEPPHTRTPLCTQRSEARAKLF
jgi:hypothetical protein